MRLQLLHTDTWMFITQSGITFEDFRDELRKINIEMHLYLCAYFFCIFHSHLHLWAKRNAVNCQMSEWKEMEENTRLIVIFRQQKRQTPAIQFVPPKNGQLPLEAISRLLLPPHSWVQ